jgi:hypothetical protein
VQKIITTLVDDVDGSEASQTVTFGLDGTTYEIDLNDAHAEELRATIDKFLGAARRVGGRVPKPRSAPAAKVISGKPSNITKLKPDNSVIRAWARSNGYTLGDKGRISADIVKAYEEANS